MTGIRIETETRAGEEPTPEALGSARALIAEAEAADGTPPVSDQALLEASQGKRALLLFGGADSGAEGGSGSGSGSSPASGGPAALGIVGPGEVDLVVRPGARGRGIGTAALGALLDRASGEVRAWAHGENPAAEALLTRAGFAPVRSLFRMALDPALLPAGGAAPGADPDPLAIPTPGDLALRAFDPASDADAAAWVDANAAAFADHPEQGRITLADFAAMRAEPWFDPADLILLGELDAHGQPLPRIAGSTWIKTVRDGDAVDTELYAVGVRPERAGEGLGRLLLAVTLARMAQHAPQRVTLYVDGENARAVELYERAGFTVDSRSRQWSRPA